MGILFNWVIVRQIYNWIYNILYELLMKIIDAFYLLFTVIITPKSEPIQFMPLEERKHMANLRQKYYESIPDKPLAPLISEKRLSQIILEKRLLQQKNNLDKEYLDKKHFDIIQGWMN